MKVRNQYLGAAAVLACLMTAAHAAPFEVGYVIPNPIGEVGWDHELDRGRQAIVDHFGDKVKVHAVNSVGEGPELDPGHGEDGRRRCANAHPRLVRAHAGRLEARQESIRT